MTCAICVGDLLTNRYVAKVRVTTASVMYAQHSASASLRRRCAYYLDSFRDTNETWRGDEDDDPLARPSGTTNFILEELAKRRKASEDNHQSNAKKRIPRNTLLKFPQADRIKRLSIQVRQSCMDTLQQLIERSSNPADAQRRALDLEYEAYESAVTPQKYRLNIDGCKKNLSSLVPSATSMQTGFVNSNVMNSQSQSPSAEVPKSFKPPAKRVKKVAEMETKPAVTKTVVSPVSDFNWLMPKPSDLRQKKKKIAAAPAMEKHEKKDAGLTMMVPETMMPGPLPEGNTTRPQSLAKEEKPAQVQAGKGPHNFLVARYGAFGPKIVKNGVELLLFVLIKRLFNEYEK